MSTKTLAQQGEVVCQFRNGPNGVHVTRGTWRKKPYVDIRNYYWNENIEMWLPTQKGVRLPLELAMQIALAIKYNLEGNGDRPDTPTSAEPSKNHKNGNKPSKSERKRRPYKAPARYAPDTETVRGGQWLVPGKDHRRTPGKASFGGKGLALVCKSVAYWGRPIHRPLTHEELAACTALTQTAQHIGRIICQGDPPSGQEIRPAVFLPGWVRYVAKFGANIRWRFPRIQDKEAA